MIKGVNHTIIEVSNPCSRYFERAFLFIRPQLDTIDPQHLQLEADRFVETIGRPPMQRSISPQIRRNRKIKRIILSTCWWLLGLGCGFLASLLF